MGRNCFLASSEGRWGIETSKERAKYRAFVVCMVVAWLVANDFGYCLVNMVSWMGGPLALFAIMASTVANGLML